MIHCVLPVVITIQTAEESWQGLRRADKKQHRTMTLLKYNKLTNKLSTEIIYLC